MLRRVKQRGGWEAVQESSDTEIPSLLTRTVFFKMTPEAMFPEMSVD